MNFKLQVSSVEGKYSILWVEALCDDEEARKLVMVSSDHFTLFCVFLIFLYRGIINPSYLGIMISQ